MKLLTVVQGAFMLLLAVGTALASDIRAEPLDVLCTDQTSTACQTTLTDY